MHTDHTHSLSHYMKEVFLVLIHMENREEDGDGTLSICLPSLHAWHSAGSERGSWLALLMIIRAPAPCSMEILCVNY